MTTEEMMTVIEADPYADVTFSGGDPMMQAEGFTELAKAIRSRTQKTIWCYTGFVFEALLGNPAQRALLEEIDVLVDGPFVRSLRTGDLPFRGSSNQRLIDVKKSLSQQAVIPYHLAV
jgi:anaerobic ribonucleoside-triphosphate reductase activating protein